MNKNMSNADRAIRLAVVVVIGSLEPVLAVADALGEVGLEVLALQRCNGQQVLILVLPQPARIVLESRVGTHEDGEERDPEKSIGPQAREAALRSVLKDGRIHLSRGSSNRVRG